MPRSSDRGNVWPELAYADWQDTLATLHLWTEIAGKIRLAQTPWLNHSWHVTLYVTPRGLNTSTIPYGHRSFQLEFDFQRHVLSISADHGAYREIGLYSRPVAEFYADVMKGLSGLGLDIRIDDLPNEVANPIPFGEDRAHTAYDPVYAHRFWQVLSQVDRVLYTFRTGFIGKCSPVHFFWGGFDLAVTRFSGRRAPMHPGGVPNLPDAVTREAYSHEVSSAGFWPGDERLPQPSFYSYAYPEPPGFAAAAVEPAEAYYNKELGEFILPYDAVRTAEDPDATLLAFLMSTYEAAATCANWDRGALEVPMGRPGITRAV
ncbi:MULTISPECIES: DUF5996 family protein [Rhodomicrobium]|uniref:DUF5996 family protein n=1 Tax=Rhodomicrobium TaxID=1068 RepID=UPI000B4ACD10|nr:MULTISPECIES: DUF5996 family protein [Rhodomicrobium]